jgi:tetratricopeptide (TPR) repeat protein
LTQMFPRIPSMIFLFGLTLLVNVADAQTDYYSKDNLFKFAEYLQSQGEYHRAIGEYRRYLFFYPEESDPILRRIVACHVQTEEFGESINILQQLHRKSPKSQSATATLYQIGYCYLLMEAHENSIAHIEFSLKEINHSADSWKFRHLLGLNSLHQKEWKDATELYEGLIQYPEAKAFLNYARNGQMLPRKNPFFAAALSAVVPGTGKMYTGLYGDGGYTMLTLALTGWQTYDGFHKNGLRSAKGWIMATLTGFFYFGNIYGSFIAAKLHNKRLEDEFLYQMPPHSNPYPFE